jgi:hypothetical protein
MDKLSVLQIGSNTIYLFMRYMTCSFKYTVTMTFAFFGGDVTQNDTVLPILLLVLIV